MPIATADPVSIARFLGQYTKQFHAGAFAYPTAKELAEHPKWINEEQIGSERAVVIAKHIQRESRRTDFTGAQFVIPGGSYVATHLARTPGLVPDLSPYTHVMAYAEDHEVSATLAALGKRVVGSRVTSAAEVINCWGPAADAAAYPAHDLATVTPIGNVVPDAGLREQLVNEVATVAGWDDDFPYYSDGSWSAVCLKGYWRDEPGRGVKPAEMPKTWKAKHMSDLERQCEWTILSDRLPALTELVKSVPWWRETERVRLLKMGAGGKLGRHTDITDRAGGTRDGQIVRFHIPLITDPAVTLHTWGLDGVKRNHHLAAWHCYYLDARKPHAVTNASTLNRVHLVADVVADADVRAHIGGAA